METATDSDGSVNSDDVITSVYPVKPRRTLKSILGKMDKNIPVANKFAMEDSDKIDGEPFYEETIEFFKIVETVRREVFEAERERERLEITYQVIYFV